MLVIGNRGVGKSFWSAVLVHRQTREELQRRTLGCGLRIWKQRSGFMRTRGRTSLHSVIDGKIKGDPTEELLNNEAAQERAFYMIAGEYMGAGSKRGRTYSWIYDHLADAFGETSPRSFLTALQRAAVHRPAPTETAVDHNGIRAGVQVASEVRVKQLKEDYDWIDEVLSALEGLEVPCEPEVFKRRWRERGTVNKIRHASARSQKLMPLELEKARSDGEAALLLSLNNIGVVEFRTEHRINMPDIFRVEARIKRRVECGRRRRRVIAESGKPEPAYSEEAPARGDYGRRPKLKDRVTMPRRS